MVKNEDGITLLCPSCGSSKLKKNRTQENEVKGDESMAYYTCKECKDEFVEEEAGWED